MRIQLSRLEFNYLNFFLTNANISHGFKSQQSLSIIDIDEDEAVIIRQLLMEELIYHLDYQYEPTETGIIIESLIDKLFFYE